MQGEIINVYVGGSSFPDPRIDAIQLTLATLIAQGVDMAATAASLQAKLDALKAKVDVLQPTPQLITQPQLDTAEATAQSVSDELDAKFPPPPAQ